jgi:hypothetical protein
VTMEIGASTPPLGEITRPELSSTPKALDGLFARKRGRSRASTISIVVRRDGAVALDLDGSVEGAESGRAPVIFRFRAGGAAEAVLAGAVRRLADARMDERKLWFLNLSAGQAAAAVKAEAKGLACSFAIIHPYLEDAPIIGSDGRSWKWRTEPRFLRSCPVRRRIDRLHRRPNAQSSLSRSKKTACARTPPGWPPSQIFGASSRSTAAARLKASWNASSSDGGISDTAI